MKRRWKIPLAIVVAVVEVIAFSVVLLTLPPSLTLSEAHFVGVIEGNFMTIHYANASLALYFNATTYANQSTGPSSSLTLRLLTNTYYDAMAEMVIVDVNATVQGKFASNVRPTALELNCNQTGPFAAVTVMHAVGLFAPGRDQCLVPRPAARIRG